MPSNMENIMERMRREGAAALASVEAVNQHDDMVDTVTMAANEAAARGNAAWVQRAMREQSARRLPPIIDDPFVPTPEQGEALERINQLKQLIDMRGPGGRRKALEKRLAKLIAELPANAVPPPRMARRMVTGILEARPAQPVATTQATLNPPGTICVEQTYAPAPQHQPVMPVPENPTRCAADHRPTAPPVIDGNAVMLDPAQAGAPGGTVRVRGAIDGRPLRVRPSVRDFVTRLRTGRA
jgi:hypothetical protein